MLKYAILEKKLKGNNMSGFEYSVISEIKKSDKSNVYLSSVTGHEYPVIVKEIRHGNIQVFEALKGIDSEYLPKIYHIEETEDGLLVVEEYVDGELLAGHLVLRKMTEEECLDIAEQICDALEVLHSHEPTLIHRDIKPSNLIITPKGKVKLIDYDSSRLYKEGSEGDTRLLGTEKYAPPEQYGFSQTDCRSDIYSLGVVLEKFTDFLSENKQKLWKQLVEKCTLFSPDSRYQSVSEVRCQIERIRKSDRAKYMKITAISAIFLVLCVPVIIYLATRNDRQSTTLLHGTTQSTEEQTSETPIMDLETTEVQITENPTTEILTTEVQITDSSITEVSTTEVPTMETLITETPTTEALTTEAITDIPIVRLTDVEIEGRNAYPRNIYAIKESDTPKIAALKKHICDSNALVLYHLKFRINRDFLYQVVDMQSRECTLSSLKLISETDGEIYVISEMDYTVKDGVIIISCDYLNSLKYGFYTIRAEISDGDGQIYGVCAYVYIGANTSKPDPQESYLQFYPSEYKRGSNEYVQLVLRNYGCNGFSSVEYAGNDIGEKMYKILEDSRILEISAEYMNLMSESEYCMIRVYTTSGPIDLTIKYID